MNEMIITNAEFGSIRIEMRNGEPWFVGSSIAKVLKYQNQQKAIRDHVDAEDKLTEQIVLAGQRREVTLINESGLYSLILSSKMEEAKRFKHWITSEVLPAIRKTGGYQQTAPQGKELLALAVLEAQKTIEEQNRAIERMRTKEIFADAVSASKTSILIGDLAKLIKQNGVDIGEAALPVDAGKRLSDPEGRSQLQHADAEEHGSRRYGDQGVHDHPAERKCSDQPHPESNGERAEIFRQQNFIRNGIAEMAMLRKSAAEN